MNLRESMNETFAKRAWAEEQKRQEYLQEYLQQVQQEPQNIEKASDELWGLIIEKFLKGAQHGPFKLKKNYLNIPHDLESEQYFQTGVTLQFSVQKFTRFEICIRLRESVAVDSKLWESIDPNDRTRVRYGRLEGSAASMYKVLDNLISRCDSEGVIPALGPFFRPPDREKNDKPTRLTNKILGKWFNIKKNKSVESVWLIFIMPSW